MMATRLCHCGSLMNYNKCCERFINQTEYPLTAEQLMRSRFTAFKLRKHNYLIKTFQVKKLEAPLCPSDFDSDLNWLGLRIISTNQGNRSDQRGFVEFVAFYQEKSRDNNTEVMQLHEKSFFEKFAGHWLYVSGIPLPDIKLVRNDKCFCNSGKKYKKCHGV